MSQNSVRRTSSVDYVEDILFFLVCLSLGANKSWELGRAASTEYTKTEKQTLSFFFSKVFDRHTFNSRVLHQFVKTCRRQFGSPPAPESDWKDPVASKAKGVAAAAAEAAPHPRPHLIPINSAKSESLPDIHSHFRPPVTWTLTQK